MTFTNEQKSLVYIRSSKANQNTIWHTIKLRNKNMSKFDSAQHLKVKFTLTVQF